MKNSKIEWTHHTANLWHGCQKVHAGCDHCYAEAQNKWLRGGKHWGPHAPRMFVKGTMDKLRNFQTAAATAGEIHSVFVGSMMDIFEKPFPLVDNEGEAISGMDTGTLRALLFQNISLGLYPNLQFLLLTKRPGNILKYIPEAWKINPPANVMYGCSVVDQETADRYIPELLRVPGRRFLSMEPLIGPVSLTRVDANLTTDDWCMINCLTGRQTDMGRPCHDVPTIDWVIVGGESGHHARPMNPNWARSIQYQCAGADVPFFFKQWGEWLPEMQGGTTGLNPGNCRVSDEFVQLTPDGSDYTGEYIFRVGKAAAGRLLDGQEWNQMPPLLSPPTQPLHNYSSDIPSNKPSLQQQKRDDRRSDEEDHN